MKKIHFLSYLLLLAFGVLAQPQKIKYQGVARNSSGNALVTQTISLRISLRLASTTGSVVYQETFNTVTNQFGLFYVSIGTGAVVSGTFASIPWGQNDYYQETEMDPTGGSSYTSMGVSQLVSVPYAFYANSALSANNGASNGFHVNLASGFAVSPSSTAAVNYTNELYDDGNNFAGGVYTAPVNGFYHFDATVGSSYPNSTQNFTATPINSIIGHVINAFLKSGTTILDGATETTSPRGGAPNNITVLKLVANVWLNAGQTVSVTVDNGSSTLTSSVLNGYTQLSGYKIY